MAKSTPAEPSNVTIDPAAGAPATPSITAPATEGSAAILAAAADGPAPAIPAIPALPEPTIDEVGVRFREGVTREAVVDRVDASLDRRGEPTSAELRPEPALEEPAFRMRREMRDAYGDPPLGLSGVLPATTRVLASGEEVAIRQRTDDGETRQFETTIRTLRGDTVYDAGAMVPLTRTEFESKRAMKAIAEDYLEFEDGA